MSYAVDENGGSAGTVDLPGKNFGESCTSSDEQLLYKISFSFRAVFFENRLATAG